MKFSCRKQINAPVVLLLTHILMSQTWARNAYGPMQRKGNKNEEFASHRNHHIYILTYLSGFVNYMINCWVVQEVELEKS